MYGTYFIQLISLTYFILQNHSLRLILRYTTLRLSVGLIFTFIESETVEMSSVKIGEHHRPICLIETEEVL